MSQRKIAQYLNAATRENTRQRYQSAISHFEVSWRGLLPATAETIAQYLAAHAGSLANSTLRQRLSAIAAWHTAQEFPDPTKAPLVKKVLKGIQEIHPRQEKQAKPIQIETLEVVDTYFSNQIELAKQAEDITQLKIHLRNRALVLIGFWRAFRSDELCRLNVENIQVVQGEGMSLYLPRTKTAHLTNGVTFHAPLLTRLCPVSAYQAWIHHVGLVRGPVFRNLSRWGRLADTALNPRSIIPMLRKILNQANIDNANGYSSHSLRRGFASWASQNDWELKSLMTYVGWKHVQSAIKYIDADDRFGQKRIQSRLSALPSEANNK